MWSHSGFASLHVSCCHIYCISLYVALCLGVPCEVQSVTITEIVCRTPPEPEKQTSYPGELNLSYS